MKHIAGKLKKAGMGKSKKQSSDEVWKKLLEIRERIGKARQIKKSALEILSGTRR